ncbi:type II secretion system secretin GspD [Verrucomicrobiota bacterium]
MKFHNLPSLTTVVLLALSLSASAQQKKFNLSFESAPVEQVSSYYGDLVGRTVLQNQTIKANLSLKGRNLTKAEVIQAIETVLEMNNVALVPVGDKFLKVVVSNTARKEGIPLEIHAEDATLSATDKVVTRILTLKHADIQEAQGILQQLMGRNGNIQPLERSGSLMITDSSLNLKRMLEVLEYIDQPTIKIEPRIYELVHAEAGKVASKLTELVEIAQAQSSKPTTTPARQAPAGVIRARTATRATPAQTTTSTSGAPGSGMIEGFVKITSDERTNILIIFTKESNFEFFDKIIKVLDIPVDPAVIVEVVNLEYAEAKEIAGVLNEFVGAAKETEKSKSAGANNKAETTTPARTAGREGNTEAQQAIGRLSEDTKILSDERTNSLLLMGRKSDIAALRQVIKGLDVMLEQVLIEAVILSVGLDDSLQTGVQWVYQNVPGQGDLIYTVTEHSITNEPVIYNKPEYQNNNLNRVGFDAAGLASNMVDGALSYYGSFPRLNVKAIVSAAKSDGDARILSTPVVMTTDNTEAKITVAEERPVVTSSVTGTSSTTARSTYQYKTIGIDLTVTPHINPGRFVLMEIKQSADDVGGNATIDGNEVPIISKREINATVAVQDRSTIVLGGLVRNATSESATKIPLLGDIPLLGWFFSSHKKTKDRQELVVLLTPYVLTNNEEVLRESARRLNASDAKNSEWPRGWSESPLRNDEPAKKKDLKNQEQKFKTLDQALNEITTASH